MFSCSREIILICISISRKGIEFGIFSQQELERISTLELNKRYLYDLTKPQRPPIDFGALDQRLVSSGEA